MLLAYELMMLFFFYADIKVAVFFSGSNCYSCQNSYI